MGANVYYSVGDPMLFELLDVAKRIITSSLAESQLLLSRWKRPTSPGRDDRAPRPNERRDGRVVLGE